MRPAIGLATFLLLAWLAIAILMLYSLATIEPPLRWEIPVRVMVRATAFLVVVETGVLLSLILLCRRALKSREVAEQGDAAEQPEQGRIHI